VSISASGSCLHPDDLRPSIKYHPLSLPIPFIDCDFALLLRARQFNERVKVFRPKVPDFIKFYFRHRFNFQEIKEPEPIPAEAVVASYLVGESSTEIGLKQYLRHAETEIPASHKCFLNSSLMSAASVLSHRKEETGTEGLLPRFWLML
jgi:hypothetical protein